MQSLLDLRKEMVFDSSLTRITLDWLLDDVYIYPGDDDHIRILQKANQRFSEQKLFHAEQRGEELFIIDGRKQTFNIGLNVNRSQLDIIVPKKEFESIHITSAGGRVNFRNMNVNKCVIKNTSGKINVSGRIHELHLKVAGAGVTGEVLDVGKLRISSTSSKTDLSGSFNDIESHFTGSVLIISSLTAPERIHSVSTGASVRVTIPDNDGFSCRFKKLSGSFKSDFPVVSNGNDMIYLAAKRSYLAEVRGGQFILLKA
ncbi:DUF4097 domain-containing protein [Neobacillus mesonae]|nr:DUF4097 domain-containing protein [Neobacillus mesonae]